MYAGIPFVGGGSDFIFCMLDAHQDLYALVGLLAFVRDGRYYVWLLRLLHHLLRMSLAIYFQLVCQPNSLLFLFAKFSGNIYHKFSQSIDSLKQYLFSNY